MTLARAIEGARHVAQQVTWKDEDGDAVDLTGATITGYKLSAAGTATALDGTFNITDATNGVFTWTYGTSDVGTVGEYQIQFIATYSDSTTDKTLLHSWEVLEALDV